MRLPTSPRYPFPAAFVSYSRQDLPFAVDLVKSMRGAGVQLWLDLYEIRAGDNWRVAITAAIETSEFFVVVLSPFSVKSGIVLEEIKIAVRSGKVIIPLLLQRCKFPEDLRDLNWIDFRVKYKHACNQLRQRLTHTKPRFDEPILPPPRTPVYLVNFTPLAMMPIPVSVRVSGSIALLDTGIKVFLALIGWSEPWQPRDVGLGILLMICGLLQGVMAFRAAYRRHPLQEMLVAYGFVAFFDLFLIIIAFESLVEPLYSIWIIPCALDFVLLLSIISPKSYRRWMISYVDTRLRD